MTPLHHASPSWPRLLVAGCLLVSSSAMPIASPGARAAAAGPASDHPPLHGAARPMPRTEGICLDHLGDARVSGALEFPELVLTGDVNEDGILDAVVQSASQGQVLIGQGSGGIGDGTFVAGQFWFAVIGSLRDAELADVNDDGILDVVRLAGTIIEVRLGQGSIGVGNGTFGSATTYATTASVAMVTGDFNEDGITDLAVADDKGASPGEVEIRLGQGSGGVGNGTFGAPTPVYSAGGNSLSDLITGDFNEDGIADLIVGVSQNIQVLLGGGVGAKGNGTFTNGQLLALVPQYPPTSWVTGDFNEDGITDLAGCRGAFAGSHELTIFHGQGMVGIGNGQFAYPVVYGSSSDARGLQIADFSGDGIADLAVSLYAEGKVAVRLGQGSSGVGNGTFGSAFKHAARGNQTRGLTLGDFVEDGMPDVAVAVADSARVSVLPWDCGSPDYPTGITVSAPNGSERWVPGSEETIAWTMGGGVIAVNVDVSRDGGQNWERVARNLTGTSFAWTVTAPTTGAARVRVTDATVAGRTDQSNATFTICEHLSLAGLTGTLGSSELVLAGDVNEDGILDAVVQNLTSGQVLIGQGGGGIGDGAFVAGQQWPAVIGSLRDAELADVNDDGILDVVRLAGTLIEVRLGQGSGGVGNGTFGSETTYPVTTAVAMVTGDFNEDGITDLAVADEKGASPGAVDIRLGQGSGGVANGTFGAATPVYNAGANSMSELAKGDFNEDGITDLVVGQSQQLQVLLGGGVGGKGNGTFTNGQLLTFVPHYPPTSMVTGDFNEDGITDLAGSRMAPTGPYDLSVFLGQGMVGVGTGAFAAPVVYGAGVDTRAVRIGDFNGDGIADAAISRYAAGKVALRLGQGSGTVGNAAFGLALEHAARGQPYGFALGDFLEDGWPDVVAAVSDSTRVTVLSRQACAPSQQPTSILVGAPNGGESWAIAGEQTISWTRDAGVIAVDVEVSRDNGQNWERVASNVTGTSFVWTVTGPATGVARVRVTDATVAGRTDLSNAHFGIGQPPLVDVGDPAPLRDGFLSGPFPNPFSDAVAIELDLPRDEEVVVEVCDLGGRRLAEIAHRRLAAGRHRLVWDAKLANGSVAPAGLYIMRARSSQHDVARRVVRIR